MRYGITGGADGESLVVNSTGVPVRANNGWCGSVNTPLTPLKFGPQIPDYRRGRPELNIDQPYRNTRAATKDVSIQADTRRSMRRNDDTIELVGGSEGYSL